MSINHTLLLRQLKRLGIDISSGQTPTAEQWLHLLDRVNQAYTETDQERYLLERSQEISSRELRELYTRIEESQRIAGFGNWFFNRTTGKGQWSKECFRIFGANPESLMPSYRELSRQVHRNDRVALKNRAKTAVQDGKDFEIEFRFLLGNGETRWVWLKGQPVKDANGIVNCLHGTVMDVTRRKVVELRQSMEHTITRLLAESGSLEDAIPEIIQAVCETLGWACGALWTLDRHKGSLRRTVTWSLPRARTEEFFYTTKQVIDILTYEDLIGQTLRAKVPIWNPDVTQDANFLRGDAARAAGLRAAFAFPIQAREETLGVMEFFGKQAQQVDQEMLQSAHFISRHIGQFLQRKQAEDALREREAHFRALVEQASDSFYVHDVEGRIIDVNQHGCDCLGYTREELLSMKVRDIDGGLSPAELTYLQDQTINKAIALESRHRRKDGSTFPVEIRMGPIEIDGHRHLLSLVRDVTERKELQDHIQHLAYHDPLTNLPNRAMFNRHLSHAIAQAQRHRKGLAVLFIDLDRFKNINDTLGHNAGDQLLQEMARRITSCLRGSDIVSRSGNNADMVARLGPSRPHCTQDSCCNGQGISSGRAIDPYHREHRHQHLPRRWLQ